MPHGTLRGAEARVTTTVAGCQGSPAVASAPDGSFVVVWQSQGQDGDGWGIFAQRFDRTGAPAGSEIAVNQATAGDQQAPAVAYDPSGTSSPSSGRAWGVQRSVGMSSPARSTQGLDIL